ncbi:Membrane associated serine protease, rhomboid family [Bryocella elongata]|uniref:Membrane associated serine protease, rhomboid family n=1 Tax=Bryocella elongata TaxID=863522 RepID=A0A1H6A8I8_9BACT|nr:rhomboid family intramembrane serine protease [Bryocella elongata]SEG44046.1 Membrane associated serine protease, rhomboid family [Bryocella elongata]
MAFRSNGPVMLALPAFRGVTRQLVLAAVIVYFALAVLGLAAPAFAGTVVELFSLSPAHVIPMLWQPVTYSFLNFGLIGTIFALLSIWFFGSVLEDDLGGRWLAEYFFVSTIAGGALACVIAVLLGAQGAWISRASATAGMWPAVMAILLAYARFYPDQPLQLMFVLSVKARHLAAIYLLVYLAMSLISGDRFSAVTVLCVALAGFLYIRFTPKRGVRFLASETIFGWRNAWYRAKRRRAAKKFQVYMRNQGRDVNIDSSGRYVDLDDEKRNPRDPNDKRWMN